MHIRLIPTLFAASAALLASSCATTGASNNTVDNKTAPAPAATFDIVENFQNNVERMLV